MLGLVERVTDHLPQPDPRLPRERLWHVRAKQVVHRHRRDGAAAGISRQRPPRHHAGRRRAHYLRRYGVKVGTRVVIATADDSAYAAAIALQRGRRGDRRRSPTCAPEAGRDAARAHRGLPAAHRRRSVTGTSGSAARRPARRCRTATRDRLRRAADVRRLDAVGASVLAVARQAALRRASCGAFLPGDWPRDVRSAGACNGTFDAGCVPARKALPPATRPQRGRRRSAATGCARQSAARPGAAGAARGKAFVDFQNDVTAKDLRMAAREGFRSIEHVKRYTTTGMATDQGKTSNMNALAHRRRHAAASRFPRSATPRSACPIRR